MTIVRLDALLEVLTRVFCFVISFHAFRLSKVAKSRTLRSLETAFMLLAAGFFIHGIATYYFAIKPSVSLASRVLLVGYLIRFLSAALAYGLLAITYVRGEVIDLTAAVIPATLPFIPYEPTLEFVLAFLLLFTVMRTFHNSIDRKTVNSFPVFQAFLLVMFSHLCFAFMWILRVTALYLTTHALQFVGFFLLIVMLLRVRSSR
jgi:hypothetical protein